MLITKEQQEALITNYIKQKHSTDECIGFIDGVEKVLQLIESIEVRKQIEAKIIYNENEWES